jgi:Phasin protein
METKGRRSLRASGPVEPAAGPVKPIEAPIAATRPSEVELPPPHEPIAEAVAEPAAELAKKTETAVVALATAPISPSAAAVPSSPRRTADDLGGSAAAALAESQAALARGLEALSAEMAGLALAGINTVADTAKKFLGIRTLSDAIEVNAGFTRSSFDALVGGSAKLSEIGVKLASETSQPLLTHLGKGWKAARQLGG